MSTSSIEINDNNFEFSTGLSNFKKFYRFFKSTLLTIGMVRKRLDIDNKIYYCDGFCKDTNTIYEFYGDFFHGNPNIYNNEDINKLTKKSFGELYDKTIERENVLKNQGYNLISIWENDYKN